MYSWALNTRWAVTEKESNNLSFFCYLSLKGKGRGLMLQAVNIKTIKCTRHHILSTDLCGDGCRQKVLTPFVKNVRKKEERVLHNLRFNPPPNYEKNKKQT